MRFCLIDDDPDLLATLQKGLGELGHECESFQSSTEGLERLLHDDALDPDIILLDVMMPDMDGWSVLSKLREGGVETPVIYVSAREDIDDRVRGLSLTADDYVVKPFAFRELLARVDAVLRRRGYQVPLEHGRLVIQRTRRDVEFDGKRVGVSEREHAFLVLLASEPGRVHTRAELLQKLWGYSFDPQTNIVDVLVARVRRKLGPVAGKLVETVVGEGYRFCQDATA